MYGEVDVKRSETALLDTVDLPSIPTLAEAVVTIAADAALAAAQYLNETVVPHGGE